MKKNRGRRPFRILCSILLVFGGSALVVGVVQSRSDGYLTTPAERFTSSAAVLMTDEIDVDTGRPADPGLDAGELSRIRVRVVSADPSTTLFVGIGRRDAVRHYLAETAHDEFTGASTRPFHASFARRPGGAVPPPPGAQPIWVASATGTGSATLEWDKDSGPWSLIVADENGRTGLDVHADFGFRFGFLIPLGAGSVILVGALMLAANFGPRVRSMRSIRRTGSR